MDNRIVKEYNDNGLILFSSTYPGAFTRGQKEQEGLDKFPREIESYCKWAKIENNCSAHCIIQEKYSPQLQIEDADSDVIFYNELDGLPESEYYILKDRVLKSARDFQALYDAIPDKNFTDQRSRKCFYGFKPISAGKIYQHTWSVNEYYFQELAVEWEENPDIYTGRAMRFNILEQNPEFLDRKPVEGSYGEYWSLAKLLRRFIWHDRIHAKALFRMAERVWPAAVENYFLF